MKIHDSVTVPGYNRSGIELQKDKSATQFKDVLDKAISSKEDKDLKAAAQQFESMFIYQMFQQMRQTIDKGGLFKESMGEKIFQDMLDYEVSTQAASGNSLGLADIIYKQLKLDQNK